mmetsp:Transcript_19723/g.32851  ORF Transcript_19723/g.32851 Transcript_19723/m.32851 type:complete len:209 (+) Transcript_19723:95-721(+)
MDKIRWKSSSFNAEGRVVSRQAGFHDSSEKKWRARRKTLVEDRQQRLSVLRQRMGSLQPEFAPGFDTLQALQEEKEAKDEEVKIKFFQKGIQRRRRATTSERKWRNETAKMREKNLEKNHEAIFEREFGREYRARVRQDRLLMKIADREAYEAEIRYRNETASRENFVRAYQFMDKLLKGGFDPSQSYGRRKYFAKIGVGRKVERLHV